MKLSLFLLAAGLCSFSAATAQTAPSQSAPGAPGTTTASPSATPSGTAPVEANPKAAVSAGEVFTTGSPTNRSADEKRAMRQQKKTMKADGKTKMKAKM
jgi:hypothetical protein